MGGDRTGISRGLVVGELPCLSILAPDSPSRALFRAVKSFLYSDRIVRSPARHWLSLHLFPRPLRLHARAVVRCRTQHVRPDGAFRLRLPTGLSDPRGI